jgi:tetratricopeptide (TPR) repeat protein/pimeloyl-ACP methyl ester carboxylesterase
VASLQKLHQGNPERPALVLLHGLGGDPIHTWRHTSLKTDNCWPHWLGQDTQCDTWVLGYGAALSAWNDQAMPLPDQGDQVADLLASKPGLEGRRLILVGHSLGGLVIKTLLHQCLTKGDPQMIALTQRIAGVGFIATPHTGSQLATLATAFSYFLRTNEQVGNLALHDPHLGQLNTQFRALVANQSLPVKAFAERRDTPVRKEWIFRVISKRVVDPNNSDPGLPGVTTVPMDGDHFSICKPASKDDQIHASLCKFINDVAQNRESGGGKPRALGISGGTIASAANAEVVAQTAPTAPTVAPPFPTIDTSRLRADPERGRLSGPADGRLQPREAGVYGRTVEVAQVVTFLKSSGDAAVVTAKEVSGVGGIGKTEVCKAALKEWLTAAPQAVAFYVEIPDRAGVPELLVRIASAAGVQPPDTLEQLLPALPAGLYYLDNLESVAELPEGQAALRALRQRDGLRLLVSSRIKLPSVLGPSIEVGVLPADAALRLFRECWAGQEALPVDAQLSPFVVQELGCHALSLTLMARLGDCYALAELQRRWTQQGSSLANDPNDSTRHGSLSLSLKLTAEALALHPGALDLWAACSLFANGLTEELLAQIETGGGWAAARPWLVRHHILTRREDTWLMLPPLARYALENAQKSTDGFDWGRVSPPLKSLFMSVAEEVSSIASTTKALDARRWLLSHFATLMRLMTLEANGIQGDLPWLSAMHSHLSNQYQFQPTLARDVLVILTQRLPQPALAMLRLGELERRLGRLDEARVLYDRALELFEKEQYGLGQANTLRPLGDLELRLGRTDEARVLYDRALELFEREQSGLGQANTLRKLGDLERRLGRPDHARVLYDRALKLYVIEQVGLGQANTLSSQGDLLRQASQHAAAAEVYQHALALYAEEQEPTGLAYTFAELARCLHALQKVEQRDKALEQALGFAQRSEVEGVQGYVGAALVEMIGSREQAQAWFESRRSSP